MTPLERAAAAIEPEIERQERDHQCRLEVLDGRLATKALARAVLTAIREPSDGMMKAGAAEGGWSDWYDGPGETEGLAKDVYTAMIDAALAEEG